MRQRRNLIWKAISKSIWFNSGYFPHPIYSPSCRQQTEMQRWKCKASSTQRRVWAGTSAVSFTPGEIIVHSYSLGGKDIEYHLSIPCYVLQV